MKASAASGWDSRSRKPITHEVTAHSSTRGVMTSSISPTVGEASCFQLSRA